MKTERKLKTLIIDDEEPAREILRHYLRDHPSVEIIGEYTDGFTGLKAIQNLRPDLVILDIQMPKLTGLEMLELLDEWPAVIFVTAYDRYAIRAFELSAVDYLLKPFSEERLKKAVDKAVQRTGGPNAGDEVHGLMNVAREQVKNIERLVVKAGSRIHILSLDAIRYFEAVDDYVKIHTGKERYMKKMTMKYLEDRLDGKEFIRIHRSYIVAVREIRSIEKYGRESYIALLHGGEKLSMSQGGMERLKEAMTI